jgi:hypothetical protein
MQLQRFQENIIGDIHYKAEKRIHLDARLVLKRIYNARKRECRYRTSNRCTLGLELQAADSNLYALADV